MANTAPKFFPCSGPNTPPEEEKRHAQIRTQEVQLVFSFVFNAIRFSEDADTDASELNKQRTKQLFGLDVVAGNGKGRQVEGRRRQVVALYSGYVTFSLKPQ